MSASGELAVRPARGGGAIGADLRPVSLEMVMASRELLQEPPALMAAQQLEEAAKFLDLESWITRRLHHCEREVQVNLQIIGDEGQPMMVRGCRVQHSRVRGPDMGPLHFSKEMT